MFELLVKNATLPDGRTSIDIGCSKGKIVALENGISAEAKDTIDAKGWLVAPPFVDPHFHMDATLSLGNPRMNVSGTLLEGIALWGELKKLQSIEDIVERALKYCDLATSMGIGAIRSHVDTCDDELKGVQALLEVRDQVKDYIDLQLVAFPQDGVLRDPTALENTIRALDMGVDIVGGIPHFERTMQQGADSVKLLCELAAERGLMVDMHCDESDDPLSRHIETLTYETKRLGLQGRVAGSHLTSMHSMDNYYVSKLIPLIIEAEVHAIPNPLINICCRAAMIPTPNVVGKHGCANCAMRELRLALDPIVSWTRGTPWGVQICWMSPLWGFMSVNCPAVKIWHGVFRRLQKIQQKLWDWTVTGLPLDATQTSTSYKHKTALRPFAFARIGSISYGRVAWSRQMEQCLLICFWKGDLKKSIRPVLLQNNTNCLTF